MRVFVPMPDEWDSGLPYPVEALVPYRAGLPIWREPGPEPGDAALPQPDVPRAA